MTLKAILIDDEPSARKSLSALLESFCPNVELLAQCTSVETGLAAIEANPPDLLFLDIEMPEASGFELLERIPDPDFEVVFTTAYEEYAIKAIKSRALDYLVKPIDIDELTAAVQRVEDKRNKGKDITNIPQQLMDTLRGSQMQERRIILPQLDGFQVVIAKDIVRCEASGNYTTLFLQTGKKITVSRSIKEYEGQLGDIGFLRVHQSHLINLNHVASYERGRGGYAVMLDGTRIEISRRKKDLFLSHLLPPD